MHFNLLYGKKKKEYTLAPVKLSEYRQIPVPTGSLLSSEDPAESVQNDRTVP